MRKRLENHIRTQVKEAIQTAHSMSYMAAIQGKDVPEMRCCLGAGRCMVDGASNREAGCPFCVPINTRPGCDPLGGTSVNLLVKGH